MRTTILGSALALSWAISTAGCQESPAGAPDLAHPADMSMTSSADGESGTDLAGGGGFDLGSPGSSTWARSPTTAGGGVARSVAVDSGGSAFMTGFFSTRIDFGGGPLATAGGNDIFLAKYSTDGNMLWGKRFGGSGDDVGWGVATDGSGNVVVVGEIQGSTDFGGGPLVSAGDSDIFVAKFTPAGALLWSRRFGGTGLDQARAVAIEPSGTILVTGQFAGSVDFGGGALASAGGSDIFVLRLGPDGGHLLSRRFGGPDSDTGNGVAVDNGGNILVAGQFYTSIDFGGGTLVDKGYGDIFVAKLTAGGAHVFSKSFGSAATEEAWSVAADPAGNVLVTGVFEDKVDFGGGTLTSGGGDDIFIAKYGPTGSHLWSKGFGSLGTDTASSVASDKSGNVIFGGYFYGTVSFGGGPLTARGLVDIFVVKLSPGGQHVFSSRYGSTSINQAMGVAADPDGNVFATGYYSGSIDFGWGPFTNNPNGGPFLLKHAP